jgi:MFS transporter, DHA3 family, macrolide efflux protein
LILWTSQAFSLFGSAVVGFALAWYLTIKTGSATILATSMLLTMLPQIILGPLIGPFIDRWDRKKIMILADLAVAMVTAGLAALFLTNTIQVWHIYVAMAARAIGQTIQYPAMQAAIPMITPHDQLSRAAGLNQALQGMIGIAGPPAGAVLLGLLPMQWVLAIDVITAFVAISCLLPIFVPKLVRDRTINGNLVIRDMKEGFRYIWARRGLTIIIGLSAIISFFLLPVYTLIPIMVNRYLESDVLKLGWLQAAFGIGIIAGGLILGAWGGFKRRVITCLTGVVMAGVATVGLGFITQDLFIAGAAFSFLIGAGISFASGPITAALQTIVAKEMQGRVFSLNGSISWAMTPLGLAIAGPAADAIGLRPLYFIAGAAIILVGISSRFIPALMDVEKTLGECKP